jgi:hypothetical protein
MTKVSEEGRGVVQLAPGHPNHPPTRGLEAAVAFTIRLESDAGPVRRAAVQLDDQHLFSPKAVSFDFESVQV